jgi:hypothetical protein
MDGEGEVSRSVARGRGAEVLGKGLQVMSDGVATRMFLRVQGHGVV